MIGIHDKIHIFLLIQRSSRLVCDVLQTLDIFVRIMLGLLNMLYFQYQIIRRSKHWFVTPKEIDLQIFIQSICTVFVPHKAYEKCVHLFSNEWMYINNYLFCRYSCCCIVHIFQCSTDSYKYHIDNNVHICVMCVVFKQFYFQFLINFILQKWLPQTCLSELNPYTYLSGFVSCFSIIWVRMVTVG